MPDSSPNVLYVTIDSIRADRVGFVGEERDTTPVMDELAAEGTTFEYAIANGIPTYYSFKSLLGGINSLSHKETIGLPETAPSLAEVFCEQGYTTAGFNAKNPWLTEGYGYDRGFDIYRDFISEDEMFLNAGQFTRKFKRFAKRSVSFSDMLTDQLGRLGRIANAVLGSQPLMPAEPLTEAASDWLEARTGDRPFFLWIHYMDPHYPWIPRDKHLDKELAGDLSRVEIGRIWHTVAHEYKKDTAVIDDETIAQIDRLYDAEVRRTDAAIGNLISLLKSQNKFENTVIAVVGDHGTELHDHGGFSHGPNKLYQEVTHVPLLFRGPGIEERVGEVAALVAVPRTIIASAGDVLDVPDTFEGVNLLKEQRHGVSTEVVYDYDPALGENDDNDVLQARTEPPWKLIRNKHTGTCELYNLEEDPKERSSAEEAHKKQHTLVSKLDTHREVIDRQNRTVAEKQRVQKRIAELKETGKI